MADEHVDPQLTSSLIGLLAVLESEAREGQLPLDVALRLRQRLVSTRVLPASASRGQVLADGLADLNERLREREAPSWVGLTHEETPLVNVLTFPEPEAAQAFAAQMQEQGKDVDHPVHEPAYQRWTVVIHHADRAAAVPGLEYQAAAAHGGRHLGAF